MATRGPTKKRGTGWRCGSCNELISSIEDGWVEWLAREQGRGKARVTGLRLVHQWRPGRAQCRYDDRAEFRAGNGVVEGLPLERFLGPDGLMLLLSLIAVGEASLWEVMELAKRVQVPGYEQAHDRLRAAVAGGRVTPAIGEGFYLQSEIRAVLIGRM